MILEMIEPLWCIKAQVVGSSSVVLSWVFLTGTYTNNIISTQFPRMEGQLLWLLVSVKAGDASFTSQWGYAGNVAE